MFGWEIRLYIITAIFLGLFLWIITWSHSITALLHSHTSINSKDSYVLVSIHGQVELTSICHTGKENFCLIHVSLVPVLGVVGEQVHKLTLIRILFVTFLL
jgi:lysophospholipid acyltransferase (LPLAT)-like uncharacterized protein